MGGGDGRWGNKGKVKGKEKKKKIGSRNDDDANDDDERSGRITIKSTTRGEKERLITYIATDCNIYILYTSRTWGHSFPFKAPHGNKTALIKHVRERRKNDEAKTSNEKTKKICFNLRL